MDEEVEQAAPYTDRWLTAVPLFITIYLLFSFALKSESVQKMKDTIVAMQMPVAWPQQLATTVALGLAEYWYFAIPFASSLIGLHFNWAGKSQDRTLIVGQLWFILMLLTLFLFTYGLNSSMLNIDSMLRKK